jgi:hypothetical protein
MATLTLNSWYIENDVTGQTVADDGDPKIRKLAFGDKYNAYFTYVVVGTSITTTTEIRFNPGMFVQQGFQDTTNLGTGNENYGLRLNNITTTFQDMIFFGTDPNSYATGRNETYQIKKIDNTTFQIKMSFFMTSDTASYLGAVTAGQYSRLTSDRFTQNPTLYTNTNTTNYTTNASLDTYTLGLYCSFTFRQVSNPLVVVDPVANTISATLGSGINFITDGWNNPCGTGSTLVNITLYLQGTATGNTYTSQATLVLASVTSTTLTFTSLTGFPSGAYVMDIEPVFCNNQITYGTLGDNDGKLRQWDWLNIDGLFANDGNHTNRNIILLRAGNTAQAINTTVPTDIQFDFTYTGTPYRMKFWMIPSDMGNGQTGWWFSELQRPTIQFTDTPVPVNLGGNNWRMTQTIDPIALGLPDGSVFHFLYVIYDNVNNYYASYSFANVNVSSAPEFPGDSLYRVIPITGQLHTYKDTFETDYLNVSPLQRVGATVRYDKADYNIVTNFNRVSRVEVTLERANGTVLDSSLIVVNNGVGFSTDPRMDVIDNSAALTLTWKLRLEHIYTLETLTVRWKMVSLTEPTETFFIQKFLVDDYQQNLDVVDQDLTDINLYLNNILVEDSDRNCDANDVKVETIKEPSSPEYYQAAVWLNDDLIVEEYDGFAGNGILPIMNTNPYQFDVEENFNTSGTDNEVFHWITSTVNNGDVGMIGYPPPLPVNIGRVMLHHTNPNGRNITFVLNEDIPIGAKVMVTLGGYATSADFTFRIGSSSPALNDANSVGWAAFPSITFAAFLGITVPAGRYVRVEYNGSLTANTDIATYLDYFRGFAPSYPRIMSKTFPTTLTAARDILFYPGTTTTYLGVSTPGTLKYTEARTAIELSANSNLTDYQANQTAWNTGLNNTAGHLYLLESATGGASDAAITLSSLEPLIQLQDFATPLTNSYYPVTANGVNPPAIVFDQINDSSFGTSAAVTSFLNLWTLAPGTVRSITYRQRKSIPFSFNFTVGSRFNIGRQLVWNDLVGGRFQLIYSPLCDIGDVQTVTWIVTRPPSFSGGSLANTFVECYVNGRKLLSSEFTGSINNLAGNPMITNSVGTGYTAPSIAVKAQSFIAFHGRALTFEEIRRIHIGGLTEVLATNPEYAWDYSQLVSVNKIPHVGTLSAPDLLLSNHTNILGTLFT